MMIRSTQVYLVYATIYMISCDTVNKCIGKFNKIAITYVFIFTKIHNAKCSVNYGLYLHVVIFQAPNIFFKDISCFLSAC